MKNLTELEFIVTEEEENKVKQPRNRKYSYLYQSYLWYMEFLELRKTHILRISAIERGKSNMDINREKLWMKETKLDEMKNMLGKALARAGQDVPVWDWVISIRGCKNGLLPAQLIAQIDDISRFDTISKLWRFCGYAVFDGKAEPRGSFQASHDDYSGRHYNGRLKGTCYVLADTFIKMQTPVYVDIYYAHKEKQRELHPVPLCRICQVEAVKGKVVKDGKAKSGLVCPNVKGKGHIIDYTKAHIHYRAIRKMMKAFLKDLWLNWREAEGLPITERWESAIYSSYARYIV